MTQFPTLETDRLLLRIGRKDDLEAYVSFYADPEASKFYGGPKTATQAWDRLARDVGHWHLKKYGSWILESKYDGRVVGGCGLMWPTGWKRPELTWWIAAEERRKGYAKEASLAAIQFGYETLGWDLVQTHMKDDNKAAKGLVLSLGGILITRELFPDGFSRDVFELPNPG